LKRVKNEIDVVSEEIVVQRFISSVGINIIKTCLRE